MPSPTGGEGTIPGAAFASALTRSSSASARPTPRNWRRRSARRRCSSSVSISFSIFSPSSSSTAIVFCGFQISAALRGSPNFASSALATSRSESARREDLVAVLARDHVLGAGLDRRLQHRVGDRDLGVVLDHADMVEHERHRAGLGQVAAGLGEGRAHLAGGAVAVVGQRLDDDRDAARRHSPRSGSRRSSRRRRPTPS